MSSGFFEQPILNSPYEPPTRHHALDKEGQPLDLPPVAGRRRSELITPVPKSLLRNCRWPALTGRRIYADSNELRAGGKKAASGGLSCSFFRLLPGLFGTPGRLPIARQSG